MRGMFVVKDPDLVSAVGGLVLAALCIAAGYLLLAAGDRVPAGGLAVLAMLICSAVIGLAIVKIVGADDVDDCGEL